MRSTAGTLTQITGVDFTNCIYAIAWRLLLEEVPETFHIQQVSSLNSSGNMLESLMAIAFFGQLEMENVHTLLMSKSWARKEWDPTTVFLREVSASGWQQRIAETIPFLERLIVIVYQVCRVTNPGGIFRLSNRELDFPTLEKNIADINALRLGWPSAEYACPGLVNPGSDHPNWIITRHPDVSNEVVFVLSQAGQTLALQDLNLPPNRMLLALCDIPPVSWLDTLD